MHFRRFDELTGDLACTGRLGSRGSECSALHQDGGSPEDLQCEVRWTATEVSLETGCPVTFGLAQSLRIPTVVMLSCWIRLVRARIVERKSSPNRPSGHRAVRTLNRTPFDRAPSWRALRTLPLEEWLTP